MSNSPKSGDGQFESFQLLKHHHPNLTYPERRGNKLSQEKSIFQKICIGLFDECDLVSL